MKKIPNETHKIYVYLNEKNEKISGNILNDISKDNNFEDATYCGIANQFITSFYKLNLSSVKVGLTDINHKEYVKLKHAWKSPFV